MKTKYFLALIIFISLSVSCGLLKEKVLKIAGIDDGKRERLMKTGVSANGTIEKVEDTYVTVNKNPKVRLFVKVVTEDGEKFDAKISRFYFVSAEVLA